MVDTVLVDQETIYAQRHGNDRLLLGLNGCFNEYELDLLRQRSISAPYEKAPRASWSWRRRSASWKAGDRHEKDPDQRRHGLAAAELLHESTAVPMLKVRRL